jgi:DMSO reductase anchor subunit
MHPAFSVIAFTTLSGAGYGLLFWLGLLVVAGQASRVPMLILVALAIALALISAGLLSSMAHLGRPERAWRAFGEWRTSWLSREGVAAVLSFVPLLGLAWITWSDGTRAWQAVFAVSGCAMAIVTVTCTSRIYDTLTPIPAWRTRWVLVNYLMLSAASGAVWLWAIGVLGFALPAHRGDVVILIAMLAAAAATKLLYWRRIDRRPTVVDAASALGLDAGTRVTPFEAPHTQANYLLKEMGFALARKHARRLRAIALILMSLVPSVALLLCMASPTWRPAAAVISIVSTSLGLMTERWLFFAQARHLVMTYYDAKPG